MLSRRLVLGAGLAAPFSARAADPWPGKPIRVILPGPAGGLIDVAGRAVGDAMPFLKRAKTIDVVTVEHKESRKELRGAQIAEHLARHKLRIDLKPIVAPNTDVASVILSYAADSSADLIVMGGYGHSRLREFVLGGMTFDIMKSMTAPVLMSH